jgi:hypothetical protein
VDAEQLERWVEGYRKAWLSNERADVEALFAEDAAYYTKPYATAASSRAVPATGPSRRASSTTSGWYASTNRVAAVNSPSGGWRCATD